MAGNINRVVLVGNLTARSRAEAHALGHPCVFPAPGGQHAPQGRDRPVDGQAELLRHHGLGAAQGENCAQYLSKGRPVAVDGRLEWREWEAQDGAKRQAVEVVAEDVQFLGGRQDGESCVRPCRCDRRRRRLPDFAHRRRHPILMAPKKQQPRRRTGPDTAPGKRKSCHFCRDKVAEIDYKNLAQLRRYISEKGKIRSRRITGACRRHQITGRGRGQAGARDGASSLRRLGDEARSSSRTSRSSGCAGTSSTSPAATRRNYLLPRRLAEDATPARVAELERVEAAAREARGALRGAGGGDRRGPRQDRPPLRGEGRPHRIAVRLGDAVRRRGRDLAHAQGARRPPEDRDRPAEAHRPLLDPDRALPGRERRGEDARRARGRRASARGGARGARGRRGEGGSGCRRGG